MVLAVLAKIKAWLHARLHLQTRWTIPGTRIAMTITVNRVTGRCRFNWQIPSYILNVERQCMANPNSETLIRAITQIRPDTDAARRIRAPFN